MYCLKCGREVYEDQVFCPDCVSVMEKYPVKPGTVILLPRRREGNGGSRPVVRRKTLSMEEQLRKQRRTIRNLIILWVITFLMLCAMSVPGVS